MTNQEDCSSPDHSPANSRSKRRFDFVDLIGSRIPMGSRKKSKTKIPRDDSTPQDDAISTTYSARASAESSTAGLPPPDQPELSASTDMKAAQATNTPAVPIPTRNTSSRAVSSEVRGTGWYGSWRQKAPALAAVRNESISANGSPVPSGSSTPKVTSQKDSSTLDLASPSPKRYMSGSNISAKSTPLAASTTNLSITSNKSKSNQSFDDNPMPNTPQTPALMKDPDPPLPPDPSATSLAHSAVQADNKHQPPPRGWFGGWWSRPDGYIDPKQRIDKGAQDISIASTTPLPESTPALVADATEQVASPTQNREADAAAPPEVSSEPPKRADESRSWFWRWSSSQNSKILPQPNEDPNTQSPPRPESNQEPVKPRHAKLASLEPPATASMSSSREGSIKDGKESGKRKSSGWAFWSREGNQQQDLSESIHKQVGELAVANTPSQSHPEAAQFNEVEDQQKPPPEPPRPATKKARGKKQPKTENVAATEAPIPAESPAGEEPLRKDVSAKLAKPSKQKNDFILPEFHKTYSLVQQPSIWQNIRKYFLGGQESHPHLHIIPTAPRVKKAIAIGVHGFFPATIIQKVLGPPTGTSIRFSNMAAAAIKSWTEARGYECEIEKVALEGEGLVADRLDTLWKLLINWIEHIRSADLILIACHSQGVPVSIMLAERLIKFGCVTNAKIAINCMAGINLGPFSEYKTQLFGKTGLELFAFSDPESRVSRSYLAALEVVLEYGVKIVYIGSIDDQLVSLESSTFSNISHPCVYRAVFVDGRHFTSDFITELVGFALKLRNLGLSDHGLIRELSPALAGSLYTGEGHSRLYDCPEVYSLAVRHALETTPPHDNAKLVVNSYTGPPGAKDANPFFLPWAMRGVLEEELVRKELGEELRRLLNLFEDWRPLSKGLKDVRFRLEALKSKL